jgi:hypothetical protein
MTQLSKGAWAWINNLRTKGYSDTPSSLSIAAKFNNSTLTMRNTYFRNAIYDIGNSSDNLHYIEKKRRLTIE